MMPTATSPADTDHDAGALRLRQRLFTALSFVLTLVVCTAFGALARHALILQQRSSVEVIAANQGASLQERLARSLSATYALAAVLRQGGGEIANFDHLAEEMMRQYGGISSLQLAKDGIVSHISPLKGNERALGHDLLRDPQRDRIARLAIATRRLTLAGPLHLIQGGNAVIGRLPIFLPVAGGQERFWGMSTAVILIPDLLKSSTLTALPDAGYDYQLSFHDPDSNTRVVFAGAPNIELNQPVLHAIDVPNGSWQLAIAPAAGWVPAWWLGLATLGSLLLAAVVARFTHLVLRQPIRLQQAVALRTAELAKSNQSLTAAISVSEQSKAAVVQLNRLYSVLSHTNGAIVRAKERLALFQDICDIAVEHGGFPLVTIAVPDTDGQRWRVAARAGDASVLARCDDNSACHLCTGAEGNTLTAAQPGVPVCPDALAADFASTVMFRLTNEDELVGVFTFYAYEPHFFDAAQLRLLEEMSSDVSFAIVNIAHEEARKRGEERLRKLSRAVEQSANAVVITDIDGTIEYVNPWFTRITGYTMDEVVGKNPRILKSAETHPETYRRLWDTLLSGREWHGELLNTKKNGDLYWCMEAISPLKNEAGDITHFVAITEDISERKRTEQTIHHLAFHDSLTELPNRRLFRDRLNQAMANSQRKHTSFALMLLDLDHFKKINDTLGHDVGDELLTVVAERIMQRIRKIDTLARMGGDEFALIASDIAHPEDAARLADIIQDALRVPIVVRGRELYQSTSIGITIFPTDADNVDTLVKNADIALYRAKDQGRDNFQFFTSEMNRAIMHRQHLEMGMRTALDKGQFRLLYQPQVDMESGVIHCAEALIRWDHPQLGVISPADFIPLAEETGMIVGIGEWVLRTACRQAREWELAGAPMRVAVNLSARQFQQGDVANQIENILRETELDPRYLEVEVTEGMLMEDTAQTAATLETMHRMGLQISIDDFGTGYSSLSYLKRLPLDILKIDQSFVRDIHTDPDDRSIVTAVIALAHSLNLSVVAEGVETLEQLHFLRELGCDTTQGYLFSHPVSAATVLAMARAGRVPPHAHRLHALADPLNG